MKSVANCAKLLGDYLSDKEMRDIPVCAISSRLLIL
ncbi:hypothetical protein SAMN05421810_10528 [Amycolatopsis arida]|uniref:Uncharacterized protein n=1 Tax=Amycolatopsis arida TaxID=587909 RepID=A0A1I5WBI9_9PSEU|nr:hypothetical protein CLV69_10547 [Amycolatopsis arida]SFQ17078.1 hypothetical protein SAMN05421810_10528 [Amycolatopsis arida]